MIEKQENISIELQELVEKVKNMHLEKYRLVQIGCTRCPEKLELSYSFDKEYSFVSLRISVPLNGAVIPSISGVYWSGFLYENEIQSLFGITFKDMVIDYKGTFYQTAVKWPFNQAHEKTKEDKL